MQPVFFTDGARALLVMHALTAMALLGATTHLVVVKVHGWFGERHERLERRYGLIVPPLFAGSWWLGAMLYPHFRVNIRQRYLDAEQPWASNLFDFKEHLISLGLPMALGLFVLAQRGPAVRPITDLFAVALWAMVLWSAISGLVITSVRGI